MKAHSIKHLCWICHQKPAKVLKSTGSDAPVFCSLKCFKGGHKVSGAPLQKPKPSVPTVATGLTLEQLQQTCPIMEPGGPFNKYEDYAAETFSEAAASDADSFSIPKTDRTSQLASGQLINMNVGFLGAIAKQALKGVPDIAMSSTAYTRYVALTKAAVDIGGETVESRWLQILLMFRKEVESRSNRHFTELPFEFYCVSELKRPTLAHLKAVLEYDEPEHKPVLTFRCPDEN
jgi:hypothetical protein